LLMSSLFGIYLLLNNNLPKKKLTLKKPVLKIQ